MSQTALPPSVQRQLDEAAALEAQLYGPAPTPEVVNTDVPQPAETPQPAPAEPAPVEQPAPQPEEETFRQRYNVLQHKYNAEVPRLHAQLREAVANITQLTAEVQRLQQATAQQPTSVPQDEEDTERFGEDLMAAIDRRATALAQQMLQSRDGEITQYIRSLETKLENVGERVVQTDQERFYAALAQRVPQWESINGNQAWLAWLSEVDPVYGQPRQAALDAAANALDANRVAAIFNAFNGLTSKPTDAKARRPRVSSWSARSPLNRPARRHKRR
jgi:molecular chaperone GrpE (heat shock protein)